MQPEYLGENRSDLLDQNPVKYGELIIIGYTGVVLDRNRRVQKSNKLVLLKRNVPNGVKQSTKYEVDAPPCETQAYFNTTQPTILYSSSRTQAIVVDYVYDENNDMFQIGRFPSPGVDFALCVETEADDLSCATISRFACRIICDRNNPSISRIYAAGFDSSNNMFLGVNALKWETEDSVDGLTTNGTLIMHPSGCFSDGGAKAGTWYEVSVAGIIYSLRVKRAAKKKGNTVKDVTNVLKDGTLIDLAGVILLWRTAEGLKKAPTEEYLKKLVVELNKNKPVCPITLNTLIMPLECDIEENLQQPYVNSTCGHVQGNHNWGLIINTEYKTCPLCRKTGEIVKLRMGYETAFYVDREPPVFFAFDPCGHVATEKTAKYWIQTSMCPFCPTLLKNVSRCVRLIFN